jgi:LysR family nitrogen assimilation transcriptional regulator
MLEWLNLGRIDCALVYNALGSATIDLQPLLDEPLFLIMPMRAHGDRKRRKSVTLAELGDYPLNIPSRPHAMRMSVETALASVDLKINVAQEIECIPAIIDLVRQGHGYAVLPMNAVRSTPWTDELTAKPILAPILKTSLSIATAARRRRNPLLRKALDVSGKSAGCTAADRLHPQQSWLLLNVAKSKSCL